MAVPAVKISLGGTEYVGQPLTLDLIEWIGKDGPTDVALLKAWLADETTSPKPEGTLRAFPHEVRDAIRAILDFSGIAPGEAPAGTN